MEATAEHPRPCGHSLCPNDATHVVIQGDPDRMIFNSGAGLACDDHTREYAQMGGRSMDLSMFFEQAHPA